MMGDEISALKNEIAQLRDEVRMLRETLSSFLYAPIQPYWPHYQYPVPTPDIFAPLTGDPVYQPAVCSDLAPGAKAISPADWGGGGWGSGWGGEKGDSPYSAGGGGWGRGFFGRDSDYPQAGSGGGSRTS